MEKKIIDLGWANGWQGTPEALQEAAQRDCKTRLVRSDTDRHIEYYECETPTSRIIYKVDTSG